MKNLERIPLNGIKIDESLNCRLDYGDIENLMSYIQSNGVPGTLEAYRNAQGELVLTDGYRRSRALKLLGRESEPVEVLVSPETPDQAAESLLVQIRANSGKRFEVWELAEVFRRLRLVGNLEVPEIAKRSGYSEGYVLSVLDLSYCPDALDAIQEGKVSGSKAIKAVKESMRTGKDVNEILNRPEKAEKKVPAQVENLLLRVYQETGAEWVNTMLEVLAGNMGVEVLISEIKQEGAKAA